MNISLRTQRSRFGSGIDGLGDCSPMAGSPWCRDNVTGNVVDCHSAPCSAPASGSGASYGGIFNPNPIVLENIPIGGFTGDFAVPTLDSYLADRLAAKESPFTANSIARGADSIEAEAQDFYALAQDHCAIYPNSSGCSNAAAIAGKYAAQYRAWGGAQPAAIYQSQDRGPLSNPTNALTGSAPVYRAIVPPAPTNALTPPGVQSPVNAGNLVNGQNNLNTQAAYPESDITKWLKENWILLAAGAGGLVLLMGMGKGR